LNEESRSSDRSACSLDLCRASKKNLEFAAKSTAGGLDVKDLIEEAGTQFKPDHFDGLEE
jgi:hypothetical protein